MNETTIAKDGENEIAVPQAWRPTLAAIVVALIQVGRTIATAGSPPGPRCVGKSAREHSRVWRTLEKAAR